MKFSPFIILSALVGFSIAAPLPADKQIAERDGLEDVTELATGVLLPVDLKNSGIDKLVGKLGSTAGKVTGGQTLGTHPGPNGVQTPGNL